MATRHTRRSIVAREVRPLLWRIGLAIGLGVLLLVFVPLVAAIALAISGGPDLVALAFLAFAVLGCLLVLLSLPVAAVGVVSLLGLRAVSAVQSHVTDRRIGLLRRVVAAEETRWWARLLRPSALLGFLDPRTAAERFDADVSRLTSAYVADDLSEAQLERELDRLFGIESDAIAPGESDVARASTSLGEHGDRRDVASFERTSR